MENDIIQMLNNYFTRYRLLYGDELYLDFNPEKFIELVKASDSGLLFPERDLESFKRSIENCDRCYLSRTRHKFVFGMGNPDADLMFVGEAPGEQEDLQGLPFVGRAGKLLDKILQAIDLDRKEVYIANVLKCRPPKNRTPTSEEMQLCEPYLHHQIALIRPKLIVALGAVAAKCLLKRDERLGKLRGKTFKYQDVDLVVTYHPSALLRNPNLKRPAWEDFQFIQRLYLERIGKR